MIGIVRRFYEWDLNRKQEELNKEYEKYGLTDEILDKQIELNKRRNELNIPDPNHLNENGFSQ